MSADRKTDDTTAEGSLTRVTFNANARSAAALKAITAASGDNRTDAINNSLRLGATLLALAHADGTLHVLAHDGTTHIVHLP